MSNQLIVTTLTLSFILVVFTNNNTNTRHFNTQYSRIIISLFWSGQVRSYYYWPLVSPSWPWAPNRDSWPHFGLEEISVLSFVGLTTWQVDGAAIYRGHSLCVMCMSNPFWYYYYYIIIITTTATIISITTVIIMYKGYMYMPGLSSRALHSRLCQRYILTAV